MDRRTAYIYCIGSLECPYTNTHNTERRVAVVDACQVIVRPLTQATGVNSLTKKLNLHCLVLVGAQGRLRACT